MTRRLERLRAWQWWLDRAFRVPGTRIRFGWDAVMGLVPGVGDVVGALLGVTILYHAHQLRVPAVVVARMVINLAFDVAVGFVPVLGDVVDVFWQANSRNLALLERHAAAAQPAAAGDWLFVGAVVALVMGLAALPIVLVLALGRMVSLW